MKFTPADGYIRLIPILAPIIILVACLGILHACWLNESRRQTAAAAELERMGASIQWAWRLDHQIVEKRVPSTPPPNWLVPGDSFVVGVQLLFCRDPKMNEKLQCLGTLRGLRCLAVTNAPVSQAVLCHLARLTRLEWVDLHDTPLTDEGIRQVTAYVHLEHLNLLNTRLTDECLPHLARFQRLKWLNISGTGITPTGLAYLRAHLPSTEIRYDTEPPLASGHRGKTRPAYSRG